MKLTKNLTVMLLFSFSTLIFSQTVTWSKIFGPHEGGSIGVVANSAQQTSDGGFIATGYAHYFDKNGGSDILLVKTDADGILSWIKTISAAWQGSTEEAYCVQQTTDGGYIIAGCYPPLSGWITGSFGLIKLDSDGNIFWLKTYGDDGYATSVQQTTDGGYIVGGNNNCALLMKTDANGDSTWSKTFGESNTDRVTSAKQTSDGGYVIIVCNNNDSKIIKTDANGNSIWTKTYPGIYNASVQQTTDNGYILAGSAENDVWLNKTDANGTSTWIKTHGGNSADWATSIQQTADGGFIVAGSTYSFGAGGCDAWLIKTNENGDTTWTKTHGITSYDYAYSIKQTSDGGYIVACSYDWNFWLIKTDGNGNTSTSIEENNQLKSIKLVQNYPNPFNPTTTINFDLPTASKVQLTIYNAKGELIKELVNSQLKAGAHKVSFNASGLNSGMYLYRLSTEDKSLTKKMILVK